MSASAGTCRFQTEEGARKVDIKARNLKVGRDLLMADNAATIRSDTQTADRGGNVIPRGPETKSQSPLMRLIQAVIDIVKEVVWRKKDSAPSD